LKTLASAIFCSFEANWSDSFLRSFWKDEEIILEFCKSTDKPDYYEVGYKKAHIWGYKKAYIWGYKKAHIWGCFVDFKTCLF
jgi:hypothetical protein